VSRARVTQAVIEVLLPTDAFSPTTPTGAGVSQAVMEVLGSFPGSVRVSQAVIEVLMADNDTQSDPGGGGEDPTPTTHAFGYAV
jgi:hypothetical protein